MKRIKTPVGMIISLRAKSKGRCPSTFWAKVFEKGIRLSRYYTKFPNIRPPTIDFRNIIGAPTLIMMIPSIPFPFLIAVLIIARYLELCWNKMPPNMVLFLQIISSVFPDVPIVILVEIFHKTLLLWKSGPSLFPPLICQISHEFWKSRLWGPRLLGKVFR